MPASGLTHLVTGLSIELLGGQSALAAALLQPPMRMEGGGDEGEVRACRPGRGQVRDLPLVIQDCFAAALLRGRRRPAGRALRRTGREGSRVRLSAHARPVLLRSRLLGMFATVAPDLVAVVVAVVVAAEGLSRQRRRLVEDCVGHMMSGQPEKKRERERLSVR